MPREFNHKNRHNLDFHRLSEGARGFTLIELLVVISIIAILLSLLIPTIGYIRFIATGNVCVNRQKQTVLGVLMYAADNLGEMPYVKMTVWDYYQGKQNNEMGFSCSTSANGMIFPYTETMKIALCASDYIGNAGAFEPTWGGHKLPCPDPVNCKGRSNSYGAWVSDPARWPLLNTSIMDETHGCRVSQYIPRMKNSYYITRANIVTNRFTGRTDAGADPRDWCWAEVWGSTLVSEIWNGTHKYGKRRASAQANIEGAAKFRIYRRGEYTMVPFKQLTRYEEE